MTEQLTELRSFAHLSLLETGNRSEKIYHLLYEDSTRFFVVETQKQDPSYHLLEADGTKIGKGLFPLYRGKSKLYSFHDISTKSPC